MGLPLQFFPAYKRWTQDQLFIKRHHHKDLKLTKLGPIQTCLEAFLGFLGKTKMKAYKKLTVVLCCQIIDRKSVAPSSGNFRRRKVPWYVCGQDQEFRRKKSFSKIIITPVTRPRPEVRGGGGTSWNFQYLVGFLAWRAWRGGSTIENLTLIFWFSKYIFIETSRRLVVIRKKLRLVLRYYWEFFYKYRIYYLKVC